MRLPCSVCGRDLNAIGQDNMGTTLESVLCEDCAGLPPHGSFEWQTFRDSQAVHVRAEAVEAEIRQLRAESEAREVRLADGLHTWREHALRAEAALAEMTAPREGADLIADQREEYRTAYDAAGVDARKRRGTPTSAGLTERIAEVLAEHADCVLNDSQINSAVLTGQDMWSCGIGRAFVPELEDAERLHLAAALAPLIAAERAEAARRALLDAADGVCDDEQTSRQGWAPLSNVASWLRDRAEAQR